MPSKEEKTQPKVCGSCSKNKRLDPPGQIERCDDECLELEVSSENGSDNGIDESLVQSSGPEYKDQVKSTANVPLLNIIQDVEEGTIETEEQSYNHCDEQININEPSNSHLIEHYDQMFGPDYKDQVRSVAPATAGARNEAENGIVSHDTSQKTGSRETDNTPIVEAVEVKTTLVSSRSSNESVKQCFGGKRSNCLFIMAALALILAAVTLTVVLLVLRSDGESSSDQFDNAPTQPANNLPTSPISATVSPSPELLTTQSPTMSPTISARAASILSFIRNITLSNKNIFYPPSVNATPEELAIQWLVDEDSLQLSADTDIERFRLQQRYALLTLWFQTNGNSWISRAGWLQFEDECTWYGITCAGNNSTAKVITEIALDRENSPLGNNLKNTIPNDLFLLTNLKILDLSHNSITGQIPDAIGNLSQLFRLSFANMDLTGTLPSSIGKLRSLKELYLYSNLLSSTLPSSIGNLTSLTTFDISRNSLQGSIPHSIGNWTEIQLLYFFGNTLLGGEIPEEIWSLTKLTDLSLRDMNITSTISSSIGRLSLLKEFRIHRNKLTSTLPGTLGLLTDMEFFSVSRNRLEGTIPTTISNWTKIQQAYFHTNNFTGTVPIALCIYLPRVLEADCNNKVECICCTGCRD